MSQDWYGVLKVEPEASTDEITAAVERLGRQAAAMANTAPERSQQLRETVRSIKRDLLSGDDLRTEYDRSRLAAMTPVAPVADPQQPYPNPGYPQPMPGAAPPGQMWQQQPKRPNRFLRFMQTAWTCPACGADAMPGDTACRRCGVAIPSPNVQAGQAQAPYAQPPNAPVPAVPDCRKCGVPGEPDGRFCSSCGTALYG